MRTLSPVFKTLLILLLAVILGGYLAWLGRHQWLPPVASWWLNGADIQQIEGLTLSDGTKALSLRTLVIELDNGLQLDLRDIHADRWTGLIGFSKNDTVITIARATVISPPGTDGRLHKANTEANSNTAEAPVTENRSTTASKAKVPDTDSEPLTISALLKTLHALKLKTVRVAALRWPDQFTGSMLVDFSKQGDEINGLLEHDTCAECRIQFKLENFLERLSLQSTLGASDVPAAHLNLQLSRIPAAGPHVSVKWTSDLSLRGAIRPASQLIERWPRPAGNHPLTANPGDIASGDLSMTANAELPDILRELRTVTNLVATLSADNIHMLLPPTVTRLAQPLHLSANSIQPIELEISGLRPFQVRRMQGDLAVTIDRDESDASANGNNATPLFRSNLSLSSEKMAALSLQGEFNVARSNGVLPAEFAETLLAGHTLQSLDGNLRITATANLPSPQDILQQHSFAVRSIQVQLQQGSEISARIVPETTGSPLKTVGWNTPEVTLQLTEAVSLHADSWPGVLQLRAAGLLLSAKSAADTSRTPQSSGQTLSTTISNLNCEDLLSTSCQLELDGKLSGLQLPNGVYGKDLQFASSAAIGHESKKHGATPDRISLHDVNFTASELAVNGATIRQPELFAQSARCTWQGQHWKCGVPQVALSLSPMVFAGNNISGVVHLDELTFSGAKEKEPMAVDARFRSDSLAIVTPQKIQAELSSSGQFRLRGDALSGSGEVRAGNMALTSEWQHNLESAQGRLVVNVPDAQFSTTKPLSDYIKGLPIDIVDGSVTAYLRINWPANGKAQSSNQVHLLLDSVSATYSDIVAVGVSTDVTLKPSGEHWVTEDTSLVTVQRLDAGVPIDNLHFDMSLAANQDLQLKRFSGELLEGALTSDVLTWNLNGEERHSELAFTGLSLSALVKEMDAESFVASGLLDARLPLTTDRQGVTIENGTLDARAPGGRLRYYGAFSPSMLTSNPQLKLIAGALEDYNYRAMHGTITYPLSGDLKLNLKLTGRSAAIDANRDLVINLNLENNVPSMLKSLQASRDLTDVLENAVQ